MNTLESLHSHLGSLFITSTFLDTLSGGLAFNISMMVGCGTDRGSYPREVHPALPLAAVLRAAHDICADADITDEESLDDMLDTIRRQFGVVEDCNEADARRALETLEHVFTCAEQEARQALEEVSAGFPVSKGSFAVWKEELQAHGS